MRVASIFFALGVLIASLFSSCSGNHKRTERKFISRSIEVSSFDRIKLEGAYNVTISQAEVPSLKISTNSILQDNVIASSKNGQLLITTQVKSITPDEVKLFIDVDSLKEIEMEGGMMLVTDGVIKTDDLRILMKGGAHIKMELNVGSLYTRTEGGANIEFKGKANSFTAISEGAGNIDADRLEAKTVKCKVAGVGNASVFATELLDATVEGLGKIGYRGSPVVNKQINGIGFVHKK